MAKIINEDFEFTKEWTNRDDFPTRQTVEAQVRADIQLLFDELKNYINETVVSAINNHENRIATLGGGGTVDHEVIGDSAVWGDNIADNSLETRHFTEDSIQSGVLQDESVSADNFDTSVEGYVDDRATDVVADVYLNEEGSGYSALVDLIKHVVNYMELSEWRELDE